MKITFTILIVLTSIYTNYSQQHSFVPKSHNFEFENINSLSIEGYEGNEVLILFNSDKDVPIVSVSEEGSSGFKLHDKRSTNEKNSLGLIIQNKNESVIISQINSSDFCNSDDNYEILVPINSNLSISHNSWEGDDLIINNILGELEIATNFNDIYLNEVTGPMSVKTVYGSIEAGFKSLSKKGAISIYSIYEHIDLTFPENISSNLNLQTNFGNIYSDFEMSIDKDKSGQKGWTGSKIIGTINEGGVDILVTSLHENIYLRSK